jgi:hypothetical protein
MPGAGSSLAGKLRTSGRRYGYKVASLCLIKQRQPSGRASERRQHSQSRHPPPRMSVHAASLERDQRQSRQAIRWAVGHSIRSARTSAMHDARARAPGKAQTPTRELRSSEAPFKIQESGQGRERFRVSGASASPCRTPLPPRLQRCVGALAPVQARPTPTTTSFSKRRSAVFDGAGEATPGPGGVLTLSPFSLSV